MADLFPFPSNIILLNTPTAQRLFSHDPFLAAIGLCGIFYVRYMAFELIRPNNEEK